jgi:hypothetical protein
MMVTGQAHAANWVMLQGTEPDGQAARAKVWGFIQPTYRSTDDTKLGGGPWQGQEMQPNQIDPDLESSAQFQLLRARIGVRGSPMPIDNKVNYFLLAEFGSNGITAARDRAATISDASVTLNHIDGARLRLGQFKTPMSEEVFQGIGTMDYINFTAFAHTQLNERVFDTDGAAACDITGASDDLYLQYCADGNAMDGFGAVRDTGAMLFDTFKQGDWEHTYAVMVGNGRGVNQGDNNDDLDTHVYWSSERIYGGKGPRREGWKFFAWAHDGTRTIYDSAQLNAGNLVEQDYDYKRGGLGTTYRKGKYRVFAEYNKAEGMIYIGSDGGAVPGAVNNAGTQISTFNLAPEDEADGYYIDFGYRVLPSLELDVRYDVMNRGTKTDAGERTFETLTLGAQYFFNKKTRAIINYEFRDQEAPNLPSTHPANLIADSLDDRLSLQIFMAF